MKSSRFTSDNVLHENDEVLLLMIAFGSPPTRKIAADELSRRGRDVSPGDVALAVMTNFYTLGPTFN
ncbi:hypothetical protein STSP2_00301 [Anaerohalosphaera lusitana]|uniref:Uncharacterized protein n=1 Tax=Anaerohalosphaera lusitana TaxID=1936003 RepID=A0A1U9NHC2_9BACT|nr:hypothetical protein [Anaerohalosphaera lusitana]AQT67158.1 hypothetical protein STSP2_00301 [Anaerohalosphaera lusitana]